MSVVAPDSTGLRELEVIDPQLGAGVYAVLDSGCNASNIGAEIIPKVTKMLARYNILARADDKSAGQFSGLKKGQRLDTTGSSHFPNCVSTNTGRSCWIATK